MVGTDESDDFIVRYDAYEKDASKYVVYPRGSSDDELREIIAHLIERRQARNRAEAESLEEKARELAQKLKDTEREQLLADLSCFREILELQRQLSDDDGKD